MKMETFSFETSVDFYQTTRRYTLEDWEVLDDPSYSTLPNLLNIPLKAMQVT
jgi:hypothetical protein